MYDLFYQVFLNFASQLNDTIHQTFAKNIDPGLRSSALCSLDLLS
jgi:hypothetical protein